MSWNVEISRLDDNEMGDEDGHVDLQNDDGMLEVAFGTSFYKTMKISEAGKLKWIKVTPSVYTKSDNTYIANIYKGL